MHLSGRTPGMSTAVAGPVLIWARQDCEQRLGFRGGRYTEVNPWLAFLIGMAATVGFYGLLTLSPKSLLAQMFFERGPTPYFIVALSFWSAAILFVKWRKLAYQRRSLRYNVTPDQHDFVLSSHTVNDVLTQIHALVDDARHFVLFNRIILALANLRNLGRVADVDDLLRAQADNDTSGLDNSYSIVQGFVWAIPVLGFIGTVLGLSEAIGSFSLVLTAEAEVAQITGALKNVTAGLGVAFDTTLEALVAALVIQLWMTFLKNSEERFLDDCGEYCVRQIVGKLRIMPYQAASSELEEAAPVRRPVHAT